MRRKIVSLVLILGLLVGIERFTHLQTKGFRLQKVTSSYNYSFVDPKTPPPQCLFQPFYHFDSGVQSHVFVSEDGRTILKLFKHHRHGPPTQILARLRWSHSIVTKRLNRMNRLLGSALIAHQHLPDSTGVFYTHLQKTNENLGSIYLYDPLNIGHKIDLDQTEFILQKRGITAKEYLAKLLEQDAPEKAAIKIKELLDCVHSRIDKGIGKRDGNILENCGFIEDRAVELDIGSFILGTNPLDPHYRASVTEEAVGEILEWVEKKYPSLLKPIKKQLATLENKGGIGYDFSL